MVTHGFRAALLFSAMSLSACSQASLAIRPYTSQTGPSLTPFEGAYEAAKQQLALDHFGLAIVKLELALTLDPRSVKALNAIGACYDDLRRHDIAMTYYERALAIEPRNADTFHNMAVSLRMAGLRDEAEAMLQKAANLDPDNSTIRRSIAEGKGSIAAQLAAAPAPAGIGQEEDDRSRPRVERTGERSYALLLNVAVESRPTIEKPPILPIKVEAGERLPATPVEPVTAEPLPATPTSLAPNHGKI